MAATWDEILQDASWGGIAFEIASVRSEGERALDKRAYPGVDGVEIEDRARNGLSLQVRAVFTGDAYPERYQSFLAALAEGGVRELVHPLHGRLQAAVERWSDAIDPEDAIDWGVVEVTFLEHTTSALGPFTANDAASTANLVRSACDDIDAAAVKLGAYIDSLGGAVPATLLEAYAAAPAASSSIAAAATALEQDGDGMSQLAIAASVNSAIARAQSVLTPIGNYTTAEAEQLGRAAATAAARLSQLGEAMIQARPPLVSMEVAADTTLLAWSHAKGVDPAEVLRLNSVVDPLLLRRGTVLVIYAA